MLTCPRSGIFLESLKGLGLVSNATGLATTIYLRNSVDEATLRRSLFEHTGGSYPEASRCVYRCVEAAADEC